LAWQSGLTPLSPCRLGSCKLGAKAGAVDVMKVSTVAVLIGMALVLAGCDKCGNFNITGFNAPKSCSDVKPR
jgi:hypothetical protein